MSVFVPSTAIEPILRLQYSPRRALYMAHPWLLWTNVLSDVLTVLSYVFFFLGVCWLVRKVKHVPQFKSYRWGFVAFSIFLLATGASILTRVVDIWLPLYQFPTGFKIVCALASMPTAVLFAWRSPAMASNVARFFDLRQSEQRQSEALRKSEEFLDRTGRIAGVGGWELDLVTKEVTWSAETYRIHGVPLEHQPTLEEGLSFYTEECRPVITAAVEAAFATGRGWDLELTVVRLDGRRIWVRTVGTAEFRDGKPVRLAGAFQDITVRVAERVALKEANDRIALATDSGAIGIWDWDLVKSELRCDQWMHRLYGLVPDWESASGEMAASVAWRPRLHREDRRPVLRELRDALADRKPFDTEFRVLWPDGSVHNLRASGQIARDEAGRPVRMVGANWDVTESRRLTAQLAQHHELLRVTLQSIGDGVITTDAQCRIMWLNPIAERMTGWTTENALGLPVTEIFHIVHAESGEAVDNPVLNCLSHGKVVNLAPDTNLISRDGAEYGIEDSAAPILGESGELLGVVLVFHDVTEQRRLMAEASRVTKAELKLKDDFLSHVSHELRSPLTSIYSFSSIIADGLAGETTEEQQEYLGIVLKNVVQLQSMIEDLLTVTQAREGKLSIEPQCISATEAVVDALHTIQAQAKRKQITLLSNGRSVLRPAFADPTRMRQILIILLDNAVKFTPVGGTVSVRAFDREDGFVLVEVADTGCGIPPEKRQRVFENLYQIKGPDQSDTGQTGRNGLGLGLHIAKDLVMRQGGTIWISGDPGDGSVFSFTVPVFAGAKTSVELAHAGELDWVGLA